VTLQKTDFGSYIICFMIMKKHFSNKFRSALGFSNKNSSSFTIHPSKIQR